jgi:hypothetical protein
MKTILILILVFLQGAAFAIDKATLIGAWSDSETKTIYIFFPDGSMLFTFLKPPADGPVEDWHNNGTWEITSGGDVKITYRRMSNIQKPQLFQVYDGGLVSPHGPVYVRVGAK